MSRPLWCSAATHVMSTATMSQPPDIDPRTLGQFGRLPVELFEMVLLHSDFPSIASLRLTSTTLAARCMSPAYKAHFAHQKTDLSLDSLLRLQLLSGHKQLAPTVQQITVTAVWYDTIVWEKIVYHARRRHNPKDENDKWDNELTTKIAIAQIEKLALLQRVWQGQSDEKTAKALSLLFLGFPSINSLKLDARVVQYVPPPEQPGCDATREWIDDRLADASKQGNVDFISLWTACGRTLDIVTQALGYCLYPISIPSLSIFDQCFGKVQAGYYSREFMRVLDPEQSFLNTNFKETIAKVKHLVLPFSTVTFLPDSVGLHLGVHHVGATPPVNRISCRPKQIHFGSVMPGGDHTPIPRFISLMPHLESLTLYMYNTLDGQPTVHHQLFEHLSNDVRLPELQRLEMKGIWCERTALVRFLRAHPTITDLTLREIHLHGPISVWDTLFVSLKQRRPPLSKLYLENLYFGRGTLLGLNHRDKVYSSDTDLSFKAKNKSQDDIVYGRYATPVELREGVDLAARNTEAGASEPPPTRGKGDRKFMAWKKQRLNDYGPPRAPAGNSHF